MNGGQISPWTALPTSKPSSLQFHGLDTDKARRAILRLRKVDDFVERWAHLAISLDSASKLAQLAISLDSTSHLAQLTLSGVQVDDVDPTITIDLTGDTLTSEAAAENLTNWTLDPATSGLTLGAITYVSATQVTLATTGTALAGLVGVLAKKATLTANTYDSGVATYDIATETSTCTDPLVDPVLAVVLAEDTFKSEVLIENVANWTFGLGTSGLTITSVTYVDATNCTIETTGVATATTITAMIELAALTAGTYDSAICTYNLATDVSTTPDPLVDPVLAVELTLDTFKSEVLIEDAANWTFVLGTSGLTITSVTYVDATNCTIETTGVATATTITAMIEAAALDTALDSGICTYNLATDVSSCTIAPEIFIKTGIAVAAEDPTLRIVLNNDAFLSKAACQLLTNWTVGVGDTDLTLVSVSYINERTADLVFTGTAAAGTITLAPATGALIFGSTLSGSHTIDATAWARSYASSELDGTIHAYQWIPKDDIEGFVGTYTPPQDENYHTYSHIDLVGDGDFSPRLASAFYYEPAVGEENFHIYAKLLLDL